jgi:hypothetical protein
MKLRAIAMVFVALLVASATAYGLNKAMATPEMGVKTYHNLSREHTWKHVDYKQNPPVGGPHAPIWQDCGFYYQPVHNEYAVHSMEHGAVWITYRPGISQDDLDMLHALADSKPYILVSPYPNLPAPVVASAWGKQVRLSGVDDPRLAKFVQEYRQGPQTLKPGAPCTGGVSTP